MVDNGTKEATRIAAYDRARDYTNCAIDFRIQDTTHGILYGVNDIGYAATSRATTWAMVEIIDG